MRIAGLLPRQQLKTNAYRQATEATRPSHLNLNQPMVKMLNIQYVHLLISIREV